MLALQLFVLILCRQILLHRCFALSCMNLRKYKKWNWFYLPSITSWISLSNLTIIINMNHIQAYASVLSTVELNTRVKEDREKLRVIFRTFKLFPPTPVYVCLYYISGHKWFTTHRVLKSHRSKTGLIYTQSWNHRNGFVATHARNWAHEEQYCKRASCAQLMHDLSQSHCGNLEGTYILFMHFIFHIYNALENPLEKVTCEVLEKIEKIFNKFRDPVKVKLCRLQLWALQAAIILKVDFNNSLFPR